jgi:hypothetical protein
MAMETEQQAIARLRAAGYEYEFEMVEDGIRCPECDQVVAPEEVRIDETVRFEGSSNPSDEAVVFALSSGPCGHKGTLTSAFGPSVGGEVADVFRRLGRHGRAAPSGDPITEREAAEQALIEEGESDAGAELGDQLD